MDKIDLMQPDDTVVPLTVGQTVGGFHITETRGYTIAELKELVRSGNAKQTLSIIPKRPITINDVREAVGLPRIADEKEAEEKTAADDQGAAGDAAPKRG